MDLGWASASFALRANNADVIRVSMRAHHSRAEDVAEIGEVAKIVAVLDRDELRWGRRVTLYDQ